MGISAVVCTRTDASSTGPPSTESPLGIPRLCGGETAEKEGEGKKGERARDARCAMRDREGRTRRRRESFYDPVTELGRE